MHWVSKLQNRLALLAAAVMLGVATGPAVAEAHEVVDGSPTNAEILKTVQFDQHLNETIDADLRFRDENDHEVSFGKLHRDRPVILALSYFACESLCPLVRQGLMDALVPLGLSAGKDFEVVFVTIDPMDTAATAQEVKQKSIEAYGRPDSDGAFHFLRADHETVDKLAETIGFRYVYDEAQKQYAHPAGIVLVTPQGRIARYLFGIEYSEQDLRLGLVEASHNQIGSPIDRLLLLCYHYDPSAGKYSFVIMEFVRWAGALIVALMGLVLFVLWRKDSQRTVPMG